MPLYILERLILCLDICVHIRNLEKLVLECMTAAYRVGIICLLTQSPDQIKIQTGMPFAESGVVIGISPVASGMTGEKIHAAVFELPDELFCIKLRTDSRNRSRCMKIKKERIFAGGSHIHFIYFLFFTMMTRSIETAFSFLESLKYPGPSNLTEK